MKFNICLIMPNGYIHSGAFAELSELIGYALKDLGHEVAINVNKLFPDAWNIILGCHLLSPQYEIQIPKTSIMLNTEQIALDDTSWNQNIYFWAKRFRVWDYSKRNVEKFNQLGYFDVHFMQVGYNEKLNRIKKDTPQDIDILFYGNMNDRREFILNSLKKTELNVCLVTGVYGPERDSLIERSKVVLNLHLYNSKIFEVVRAFYLMSNSKAVVSEIDLETSIDDCYREGILACCYDEIVENCIGLVADTEKRTLLEFSALETISKIKQSKIMLPLISDLC